MSTADDLALAHLAGEIDADVLDDGLRRERDAHPDEVEAALLLLRLHGLLRGDAPPIGLTSRVMERVHQEQRGRVHQRVLAAIRGLPAFKRRGYVPAWWEIAAAALLLLGLGTWCWWNVMGGDRVRVIAGAWIADDGTETTRGSLPFHASGTTSAQGVSLCWNDGTCVDGKPGAHLHVTAGVLSLIDGEVHCAVKPHAAEHPFLIHTPYAEISVVGTEFTVTVGATTICRVERGTVVFNAGGRTSRIEAGGVMTSEALNDAPPTGWRLVWADEFADGDARHWKPWNRRTGTNGDIQRYAPERASIIAGAMHLEAQHDANGWTSATLLARDLRLTPGTRLELRARMPTGGGAWPLVWAVDPERWPSGAEAVFLSTTGVPAHLRWSLRDAQDMQLGTGPDDQPGFHTYAIEWTTAGLACWRDGVAIGSVTAPRDAAWTGAAAAGLSLGLDLTITPEADPSVPVRQFDISWLRIYRRADAAP